MANEPVMSANRRLFVGRDRGARRAGGRLRRSGGGARWVVPAGGRGRHRQDAPGGRGGAGRPGPGPEGAVGTLLGDGGRARLLALDPGAARAGAGTGRGRAAGVGRTDRAAAGGVAARGGRRSGRGDGRGAIGRSGPGPLPAVRGRGGLAAGGGGPDAPVRRARRPARGRSVVAGPAALSGPQPARAARAGGRHLPRRGGAALLGGGAGPRRRRARGGLPAAGAARAGGDHGAGGERGRARAAKRGSSTRSSGPPREIRCSSASCCGCWRRGAIWGRRRARAPPCRSPTPSGTSSAGGSPACPATRGRRWCRPRWWGATSPCRCWRR